MGKAIADRPILGTVAPRSRKGRHRHLSHWLTGGLAAATALFTPAGAVAKAALLVVGSTTLSASDAALKQRLDRYYTTTLRDDGASADTSKNLIVISASVDKAAVGTKYKAAPRGALVLAPAVFPAMGMTAAGAFGTLSGRTRIKVVNATQQASAGFALNALVTVYGSGQGVGWGSPAGSHVKIALADDGVGSHAAIFRYSSGATLADGSAAPARRVGYYVAAADALTRDGWKLFDHAADYADGTVAPVSGGSVGAVSWASTITRLAKGCGDWTPTWAPDDRLYTMWGDCNGITGKLAAKQSMGLGSIAGSPPTPGVADIVTGSVDANPGGLDALGDGRNGEKPSGLLSVGNALYALVRNIRSDGTQSRLRYTLNYSQPNATWQWAGWTFAEFGYPVFVQYGKAFAGSGDYAYVVANDNPSAYVAADRFILMRVPKAKILDQAAWQFFSGSATSPAWVGYADRAQRTSIFTSKGRCLRSGITYNAARGRYYWWQEIPPTWDDPDARFFGGFGIYSAAQPWGQWTPAYYTEKWDVGPGEKGELPTKWMSAAGIGSSGDLHLVFSGDDYLAIRKGTVAAGF